MEISILLVDDQNEVLDNLSKLPEHDPEIRIVRLASSGLEYENMLERYGESTDVIILDLMLDTDIAISGRKRYSDTELFSGFSLLKTTMERYPSSNIVVHSQFFNHTTVITCYKMGAKLFIPKGSWRIDCMLGYIKRAAGGEVIYPNEAPFDHVLKSKIIASQDETLSQLNEREVAALSLLVNRFSTDIIVAELGLSSEQVLYNLIARMIAKLEILPEYDADGVIVKNKREVLVEVGIEGGLSVLSSDDPLPF